LIWSSNAGLPQKQRWSVLDYYRTPTLVFYLPMMCSNPWTSQNSKAMRSLSMPTFENDLSRQKAKELPNNHPSNQKSHADNCDHRKTLSFAES
jgi:hypothetical protein